MNYQAVPEDPQDIRMKHPHPAPPHPEWQSDFALGDEPYLFYNW